MEDLGSVPAICPYAGAGMSQFLELRPTPSNTTKNVVSTSSTYNIQSANGRQSDNSAGLYGGAHTSSSLPPPATELRQTKPKARPLKDETWERYRDIIWELYICENRTLDNLIDIMQKQHGFLATHRQYKIKFKQWQFTKNLNPKTAVQMDRKLKEAAMTNSEDLSAALINRRRVDKYFKRKNMSGSISSVGHVDPASDIHNFRLDFDNLLVTTRSMGRMILESVDAIQPPRDFTGRSGSANNIGPAPIFSLFRSIIFKLGLHKQDLLHKSNSKVILFQKMNICLAIIEPLVPGCLRRRVLYALNYAQTFYLTGECGYNNGVLDLFDYIVRGKLSDILDWDEDSRSIEGPVDIVMEGFEAELRATLFTVICKVKFLYSWSVEEIFLLESPTPDKNKRDMLPDANGGPGATHKEEEPVQSITSITPDNQSINETDDTLRAVNSAERYSDNPTRQMEQALNLRRQRHNEEARLLLESATEQLLKKDWKSNVEDFLLRCARYHISQIYQDEGKGDIAQMYLQKALRSSLYFESWVSWREVSHIFFQ